MVTDKIINFISAVVYVNNNEKLVGSFIENIHKLLSENFLNFEIILIDDGSVDNSSDVIRTAATKTECNSITLVKLNNHQGYEAAMNAGVDLSNGDYVIEFDSPVMDFEPDLIMDVYAKSQEGYDIVSASNSLYKKSSSDLFYSVFNRGANLKYDVQSESFRLVSRRAIILPPTKLRICLHKTVLRRSASPPSGVLPTSGRTGCTPSRFRRCLTKSSAWRKKRPSRRKLWKPAATPCTSAERENKRKPGHTECPGFSFTPPPPPA